MQHSIPPFPRHQRVASRWLAARKDPLDPHYVEHLRKDFLTLLKNADRAASFTPETAEKYRKAAQKWRELLETYGGQIQDDLKGRIRESKSSLAGGQKADPKWAQYYLDRMKPFWDLVWEMGNMPSVPDLRGGTGGGPFEEPDAIRERLLDFYTQRYPEENAEWEVEKYLSRSPLWTREDAERDASTRWAEKIRKWAARARGKARAAWKFLDDMVAWTMRGGVYGGGEEAIPLTTVEEERVTLEGFPTLFRGFDDADASREYLGPLKEGLARYRDRAGKVLPLLLKLQLPLVVNWAWDKDYGSAAASYEGRYIRITPWGLNKDVSNTVRMLAHEMGHHLLRVYLSREKQEFWRVALRGDYKDLDLRDALRVMQSLGPNTSVVDRELAQKDPILYLQMNTLQDDLTYKYKDLWNAAAIEEYLANGGDPHVRVPASPISGYSGRNSDEAFCEAVGHLVAYGPNRLPDKVLGWLRIMLPDARFAMREW